MQVARVTRWGGMISTPDAVLQAIIKRSLIDSGCPAHIVTELMENAHERRWSNGLSTLETRQLNRRQYENYVTKRIPGIFPFLFIFYWCTISVFQTLVCSPSIRLLNMLISMVRDCNAKAPTRIGLKDYKNWFEKKQQNTMLFTFADLLATRP